MDRSKTSGHTRIKKQAWHALPLPAVFESFGTSRDGLTRAEATERQAVYGPNQFTESNDKTIVTHILAQFKSPLTIVLLLAFLVTVALADYLDAGVILFALLIAVVLGVFQEEKASHAFDKLAHSQVRLATVLREGKKHQIDANELVPGDIIVVQNGTKVPADVRFIETKKLEINEAALTGEWMTVEKQKERVPVGAPLAETSSMGYLGTFVARGYGVGVVVATGDDTVVGSLAADLDSIEDETTPIQWEIRKVSRTMLIIIVVFIVMIFAIGALRGEPLEFMLITAIAIAVASIPEGLPAAVTIILAVGMESLLKRGGLVRNLLAAETLGSTTYILTDKTGTLTEARMAVDTVVYSGCQEGDEAGTCAWKSDEEAKMLFDIALCASDAYLDEEQDGEEVYIVRGDPIERAILEAAQDSGVPLVGESLRAERVDLLPFESENRFAAGLAKRGEKYMLCINGAPEFLLEQAVKVHTPDGVKELNDKTKAFFEKNITHYTKEGRRLIGVGYRNVTFDDIPDDEVDTLVQNIVFVGLVVLEDPIRDDVADAIKGVLGAGAAIRLVTGDNAETALSVAREVGIARKHDIAITGDKLSLLDDQELLEVIKTTRVFARILPRQKMRLAQVLQASGEIVAMTGDGINDAPALRKANIGIAIGAGTEVAKESSDLVLVNNSFSTIYAAIEEGRRIIGNLRKIVAYLLATSLSEAVLIAAALVTGAAIPLVPAQILWANIIEEGLMSVAFAFEPGDKRAMQERPHDIHEEGILSREVMQFLGIVVGILGVLLLSLYAFLRMIDLPIEELRSVMFVAISVDSLFIAFSFKSLKVPVWDIPLKNNLFFAVSFVTSLALLGVVMTVPFLQRVFSYVPLEMYELALIFGYGFFSLIVIEIGKWFFFSRKVSS